SFDQNFLNNVVDATKYVFDRATELGEPAVINASIGTYGGSHDGYDLPAQMINDLITQQNGRTFVCAAGNAGNVNFHLGYQSQQDSSFTWFKYSNIQQSVFFEWWIAKNDATNFNFSIGADQPSPWSYLGRTKYYNLLSSFNYVNNIATKKDTLYYNSTRIGIITLTAYRYDSTYACDVTINPNLTSYYWRYITNGSGRFDAWNGSSTTGTSDMVSTGLPDDVTFPDIDRYVLPDYNETTVSSFTCSDKVIAVGNYVNRNEYIDYYGLSQVNTDLVGALAAGSSLGPSRDGRIKPDIAAPGATTLSAGQFYTLYGLLIYQPYKVALGGMHNRNGGTSMASPVVAGVAALYLEKNPNASWQEVKDAILLSAKEDSLTGYNLPDNTWGYGKVDAFKALTQTMVYGCTDPSAWNFDPSATLDDGSCFYTGISSMNNKDHFFTCSPNPSNGITRFYFSGAKSSSERKLVITDVTGKMIDEIILAPSQNFFNYSSPLAKGIYFCELKQDGVHSEKLKMVVQ
ncbi:MAG: S8 family serine peptidase, partial [Chitinophagales bacterium]